MIDHDDRISSCVDPLSSQLCVFGVMLTSREMEQAERERAELQHAATQRAQHTLDMSRDMSRTSSGASYVGSSGSSHASNTPHQAPSTPTPTCISSNQARATRGAHVVGADGGSVASQRAAALEAALPQLGMGIWGIAKQDATTHDTLDPSALSRNPHTSTSHISSLNASGRRGSDRTAVGAACEAPHPFDSHSESDTPSLRLPTRRGSSNGFLHQLAMQEEETSESIKILGKMMESGWQDDWTYLTKRLEEERTKRFASDRDKNQASMALRVAERDLQEERRLRLEVCQVIHDVASQGDVASLKKDLEHFRARMSGFDLVSASANPDPTCTESETSSTSTMRGTANLQHLDACSVAIQTKLDLAAKLKAQRLSKEAPKTVNAELMGLHARLAIVEKELAASRAREANMHLLLKKVVEDKSLPPMVQKEDAQNESLAAQSESLIHKISQRSRAARVCCRRFEAAFSALSQSNAPKLKAEIEAWDAATLCVQLPATGAKAETGATTTAGAPNKSENRQGVKLPLPLGGMTLFDYEGVVREYGTLVRDARAVFQASLLTMNEANGHDAAQHQAPDRISSNDEHLRDAWRVLHSFAVAGVNSSDVDELTETARGLRAQVEGDRGLADGGRGRRVERAATLECLRATAQLIETKAHLLRVNSTNLDQLTKTARVNSSDADRVTKTARGRDLERAARLQLSAFVRDISLVHDVPFLSSRLAALRAKVTNEKKIVLENLDGENSAASDGSGDASLSKQMLLDMEACLLLLQDKVSLLTSQPSETRETGGGRSSSRISTLRAAPSATSTLLAASSNSHSTPDSSPSSCKPLAPRPTTISSFGNM